MIQTFAEVLASFSKQFSLCLTGQAMGQESVLENFGLFHANFGGYSFWKQTLMIHRLSCEDLHCSIFIFLKLSTLWPGWDGGLSRTGEVFASTAAQWWALWACRRLLRLLFCVCVCVYDKIGYTWPRDGNTLRAGCYPDLRFLKWPQVMIELAMMRIMHVIRWNIILLFDCEILD